MRRLSYVPPNPASDATFTGKSVRLIEVPTANKLEHWASLLLLRFASTIIPKHFASIFQS
jgi:hypothetical protein